MRPEIELVGASSSRISLIFCPGPIVIGIPRSPWLRRPYSAGMYGPWRNACSRYSPGGTFKNENRPLASVVVLRTWDGYRSFDNVTVARGRGSPVPNLATTPSTDAVLLNCASRPRMTAHSIIESSEILDACRLYPQCYQRPFQGGAPGFFVLTQTASPGERTVKVRS